MDETSTSGERSRGVFLSFFNFARECDEILFFSSVLVVTWRCFSFFFCPMLWVHPREGVR